MRRQTWGSPFRQGAICALLLQACLFLPLVVSYAAGAEQVDNALLRLRRHDEANAAQSEALLVLRGNADSRREVALKPGEVAEVMVPAGTTWQVELVSPSLWSPPRTLTAGDAGSIREIALPLWPGSRVEGTLQRADRGDNLPRQLELELGSPPSPGRKQEVEKASVRCEVAREGRFSCPAPAAFLDLTVKAREYAPIYFWGKWPETKAPLDLGTVILRPGGSIAGWVTTEGGDGAVFGAVARVSPYLGPGQGVDIETERLRRVGFEAKASERGFFQVPSLSPGDYLLEVSRAGMASAKAFPLKVWPGAETMLREPMVLRPPLELALSIQPPLDWMGKPWHVTVRRHSDWSGGFEHPDVFAGPADEGGRVLVPGQAPGRFWVSVADSKGNRLHSSSDLEVSGTGDTELRFDIPLVIIDGEISYRDKSVPAELRFGGSFGSVAIEMTAGDDGAFSGVLPREGLWRVDILLLEPDLRTHLEVKVEAASNGIAAVKLEVPDTRAFGTVVDPEARPIENAQVLLDTTTAPQQVLTDAQGRFEFLGVPEGTVALSAEAQLPDGPGSSEAVTVELSEEAPVGPVVLSIERSMELRGTVESALGGVAGASLFSWSLVPPSPQGESARSALDGSFRLRAPARCQRLAVAVSPPGHALTFFEVTPAAGSIGTLRVEAEGGDLEVVLPWALKPGEEPAFSPVLFRGDLAIPLSVLSRWAAGNGRPMLDGKSLRVPRLAPGIYKACLVPRSLALQSATEDTLGKDVCQQEFLSAGSTTRLELKIPAGEGDKQEGASTGQ